MEKESHFDNLKDDMVDLMLLVKKQHVKTLEALKKNDIDLASEVIHMEKRINSMELSLDKECEKVLALYNPVAIDLRLMTAIMKINIYNETIGDMANGVCEYLTSSKKPYNTELLKKMKIVEIYETVLEMIDVNIRALNKIDPTILKKVFAKDPSINKTFKESPRNLVSWFDNNKKNKKELLKGVELILISKKIENVGDLCKSIAEEIVFYSDASIIRHTGMKNKLKHLKRIEKNIE